MGLQLGRRLPAGAIGAEGGRQPRGADRASAREAGEEGVVRVRGEDGGDPGIEGVMAVSRDRSCVA